MNQDQTASAELIENELKERANDGARYCAQNLTSQMADIWPPETTIGELLALQVEVEAAVSLAAFDVAIKTLAAIRARTQSIQE